MTTSYLRAPYELVGWLDALKISHLGCSFVFLFHHHSSLIILTSSHSFFTPPLVFLLPIAALPLSFLIACSSSIPAQRHSLVASIVGYCRQSLLLSVPLENRLRQCAYCLCGRDEAAPISFDDVRSAPRPSDCDTYPTSLLRIL